MIHNWHRNRNYFICNGILDRHFLANIESFLIDSKSSLTSLNSKARPNRTDSQTEIFEAWLIIVRKAIEICVDKMDFVSAIFVFKRYEFAERKWLLTHCL